MSVPSSFRILCGWVVLSLALVGSSRAVDATYTYDALGRLTSTTYACGASITYAYDAAGNRTSNSQTANCPPVAVNDSRTTAFNTADTFDPRANDSDPNGYALTVTAVGSAGHGSTSYTSASVTYTPTAGYSGSDSYSYTISNGHGGTASATISMTVSAGGNQPPVAVDDSATTFFHIGHDTATIDVLANDSDPDSDTLTISSISGGSHGTCSIVAAHIAYSANTGSTGYHGPDSCSYTISDGHSHTASANISITIP